MIVTDDRPERNDNFKPNEVQGWDWKEHIPLLLTGFSVLFVIIRLLSISKGDTETAYAILQASGSGTVVIGTFLPAAGDLTAAVGFVTLLAADSSIKSTSRKLLIGVGGFLLVLGVATASLLIAFMAVGLIAIFIVIRLTLFKARRRRGPGFMLPLAYVWGIVILLTIMLNSDPWVPAENIASTVRPAFSGYVFNDSGADATILSFDGQIVYMPFDRIMSLTACRRTSYYGILTETLVGMLAKNSRRHYSKCVE